MSALDITGIPNFVESRRLYQQHPEASANFSSKPPYPGPSPLTPVVNLPNLPLQQSTALLQGAYMVHICMMPITYIFTAMNPNVREGELGITNRMQHHTFWDFDEWKKWSNSTEGPHQELGFCSNDWKENELAKNVYLAWRTACRQAKARAKGVKPKELDPYDLGVCADDDEEGDDLEKKWSATVEDDTLPSPPPAVCKNDSETATIPVPQIKLKHLLDGMASTLFQVPPMPLLSPVMLPPPSMTPAAPKIATPISQPNAHVDKPDGESPKAPIKAITPPLITTISNSQPEPTPAISSSINGAFRVELTVEAPKKASKACPSSKKNGRDLCILCWLKQVKKDGATSEFCVYWDTLDNQKRNSYELDAAQLCY
ncbi:uncharacterized protein EDB91DRAFT_1085844 [Suillus paluster]|uniref:uncharacterized protein n=1 Tax=Suillus paluster TaxID=48578 RepID=UPI001B88103A|nr:uncharacterized protein EDB91DRAFT_1085844 [Suillus paluster]KAG1729061.1 hypothetical protein EDB91DRAFT_1085844 [Suillus paluster]